MCAFRISAHHEPLQFPQSTSNGSKSSWPLNCGFWGSPLHDVVNFRRGGHRIFIMRARWAILLTGCMPRRILCSQEREVPFQASATFLLFQGYSFQDWHNRLNHNHCYRDKISSRIVHWHFIRDTLMNKVLKQVPVTQNTESEEYM